jgi:hypothetical protein
MEKHHTAQKDGRTDTGDEHPHQTIEPVQVSEPSVPE